MPVSGSDGKLRSGFISLPPRVVLRFFDNMTGSYPTIARTGDKDRLGNFRTYFDDTDTIVFGNSENFEYPTLLHSRSFAYIGRRVATPHPRSSITTAATGAAGVSDSGIYIPVKGPLVPASSSFDTFSPFDESRIFINRSSNFWATGTKEEVKPGFSTPLWSKTQISIDISPRERTRLTRASGHRNDRGPFMSQSFTGFCYYNFVEKRWEEKGILDPVSDGSSLHRLQMFDWAARINGAVGTLTSGTSNYPLQFFPSPQRWPDAKADPSAFGYSRIGTPTCTSFAPFATKYHASASQVLKMSDYITSPFLLEKITLQLPIEAQKAWNTNSSRARDMDNYTFFLYRQQRKPIVSGSGNSYGSPPDSKGAITGSQRFLIGSGCICFYNTHVENESGQVVTPNFQPIHTPAFKHAMGALSPTATAINSFTGSIIVPIVPAVANRCYHGFYYVEDSTNGKGVGVTDRKAYAQIFNYWPGGNSTETFHGRNYTGKHPVQIAAYGAATIPEIGISTGKFSTSIQNFKVEKFDPRSHRPFGAASSSSFDSTYYVTVGGKQSIESPYLLFPEDELILGIDAGLSNNGTLDGTSKNAWNELTGSMLTMISSGSKMTLFGSMIRDGVQFHNGLNQNLTSNAIHESLHYDNPTLDQFNIESRESYIGTYIDDGITGSFTEAGIHARGVMGSFASGTAGPMTGSLLRGLRTADSSERYYDTLMPSIESIGNSLGLTKYARYNGSAYPVINFATAAFRRSMPWPYAEGRGDNRQISDNIGILLLNIDGSAMLSRATFSHKPVRRILFSKYKFLDPENGLTATSRYQSSANVTGALSFNYGIYNIDPKNSSAVFRYDRYGQFRDMLEQRQDSKFYKPFTVSKDGRSISKRAIAQSPVFIKFVSRSSEIEISPYETSLFNKSIESTSSYPYSG